jgi:hypothetical protein
MRQIMAMTNRSIALIVALALVGCRGQDQAKRSTPNYEVVSEGSANGVTSTINGPGEKPAPVTDTNIDTTTNFTLPNNPDPLGNETAGTSIAGTLPSYPTGATAAPVRRVQPRTDTHGMASSSAPIVTDTIGSATPPMPRETRTKPRSDETNTTTADSTTTSDTATDTSTTSTDQETTSTVPAPKKKTDRSKKPDDQQPPPPPPPTDTTGTRG